MSSIILLTFLLVALLGMPLAFALGLSALLALSFSGGGLQLDPWTPRVSYVGNRGDVMLPQRMMHSVTAFPLMAAIVYRD